MTMNTRQAGALTELIQKEERSRQRWHEIHGEQYRRDRERELQQKLERSNNNNSGNFLVQGNTVSGPSAFSSTPHLANSGSQSQLSLSATQIRPQSSYRSSPSSSPYYSQSRSLSRSSSTSLAPPYAVDPIATQRAQQIVTSAIRSSSPRLAEYDDTFENPTTIVKKVVKQVEVPYVREVKVPITTKRVVQEMVPQKVRVKKLVEVDTTREVEQEYVTYNTRDTTRDREVWVKKTIKESVTVPVPVKHKRKVRVPTKVLREVEQEVEVQVPQSKVVEWKGYRVDQVTEAKLAEVEEVQTFALVPSPTGRAVPINSRDLGGSRPIGRKTIGEFDEEQVKHLQTDVPQQIQYDNYNNGYNNYNGVPQQARNAYYSSNDYSSRDNYNYNNNSYASQSSNNNNSINYYQQSPSNARSSYRNDVQPTSYRPQSAPYADYQNSHRAAQQQQQQGARRLGFKVRSSCAVYSVEPNCQAAISGLRTNDVIVAANGRPVRQLDDFKAAVAATRGQLVLQIRRGQDKLILTLQR